ncbi:Transposase, MuDR, plant [Cynara cardunculus var. scolymus]|uniref:Transposase, MuDR, plant n=1 Tax=Cynara cardunculus var. scolymus TaxID=59895 RepID=A0A124SI16_CYNCS|nr:Transposase, MuDR, plant [Cynara cardunculus var. scolymus]
MRQMKRSMVMLLYLMIRNVLDDGIVDMKSVMPNYDMDVECNNKDKNVVIENDDHNDALLELEASESNIDKSDLEIKRFKYLKKLRKERGPNTRLERSVNFYVGRVFGSKKGIKMMIDKHAIETRRQITVLKNDLRRIRAVCRGFIPNLKEEVDETSKRKEDKTSGQSCPWVLHIFVGKHDDTWMVKTNVKTHKCLQAREVSDCTASFLSQQISDTLVANSDIPTTSLQINLEQKYASKVSKMKYFLYFLF